MVDSMKYNCIFKLSFDNEDECKIAYDHIKKVLNDDCYKGIKEMISLFPLKKKRGMKDFSIGALESLKYTDFVIYYTMKGDRMRMQILKDLKDDDFEKEMDERPLIDIKGEGLTITSYYDSGR